MKKRIKILHLCLESPYRPGWTYQENILPRKQAEAGCDVVVISSQYIDPQNDRSAKMDRCPEVYDSIRVIRLRERISLTGRFRIFDSLLENIKNERPNLVFFHGGQSLSLPMVASHSKKYGYLLFVDFHGDIHNTGKNTISRILLHSVIWRNVIRLCMSNADAIYCITEGARDFVTRYYGIEKSRLELLYLGADLDRIPYKRKKEIKYFIRKKYGYVDKDIVIITGGKIDKLKCTMELIEAIKIVGDERIKLLIFGSVDPEYGKMMSKSMGKNVNYVKWLDENEVYSHFLAADIAAFPGAQSVLWQQAICCGLPAIFARWPGNEYLSNGNAIFVEPGNILEIANVIRILTAPGSEKMRNQMARSAMMQARNRFSYEVIAKQVINKYNAIISNRK